MEEEEDKGVRGGTEEVVTGPVGLETIIGLEDIKLLMLFVRMSMGEVEAERGEVERGEGVILGEGARDGLRLLLHRYPISNSRSD